MSKTLIQPYLFFGGRCQEAIDFYIQTLNAQVEMIMLFKDSPQPTPPGMLQPGFEEKVMHASFRIGDNIVMASDGCNDDSGFKGFSLWLGLATISETESAFNALSDGGKITMALAPTFWSPMYGMLTDRFGVNWMVSVVEPQN